MTPTFFSFASYADLHRLQRRLQATPEEPHQHAILDQLSNAQAVKLFAQAAHVRLQMVLAQFTCMFLGMLGALLLAVRADDRVFDGISLAGAVLVLSGLATLVRLQFLRQPVSDIYRLLTPLSADKEAQVIAWAKQFKACRVRLRAARARRSVLLELDWQLLYACLPPPPPGSAYHSDAD
jgi:hypothetical protein